MTATGHGCGRLLRYGAAALVLIALAGTGTARAASVSQAGVLFLKIAPGARAGGMGEAFVAVADDATATWWNPAGLAYAKHNELTLMHVNWLPQFKFSDLYYDFLSYINKVPEWGTFGTNIIFLNLGENERRDENNNYLGTFSSYEFAVTGSYGSEISKRMALGVNMRFIFSHLSDRGAGAEKGTGEATSIGVDVGWLWQTPVRKLTLGANLSNMGPKVAYIDRNQADPLPTNLKFGFSYKLVDSPYNTLRFIGDVDKELVRVYHDGTSDPFYLALFSAWSDGPFWTTLIYHTGFEYWYSDLVALRLGYWNDELGKVKPITFGASLKYSLYRFDFSYVNAGEGHPLQDTMRFSLSIGF
ncbi:MAG TPA: PorV/PorQ family protein [Bacteroidetes bacterium]|nr:PorV/PorQ family protein [Bacteroidota bacterium]